ncbi:DUF6559 family protein [Pseudoalteromonas luteoviolacea]|uniref:Uncharacterized protein n=1 Tax=Pseudoalteromonas luteoviolacea S4054 TaxID=1129367 RepID=A0A0F6AHD8_9GAMM|nr:DUF6559 family protein [Pseudoalteromonas luteoviolacea]AOT08727.1 hypothetical protein S4054249_13070 [Pseudoalteromonas luteoviolacea]AOT13642.1 hypothetical protein S40542_13045 [Pseudoalteromonas luteoviolacea]AOT18555.1 hypothetical protein S4054_13045 [Pseudoalteromonas luteoviolacea]KKE85622.1 hypothetical protein N479_25495 [Pseudoalteromonas luteoviolacea S4054]KZN68175.1 hypothetical protein N481_23275 [Pseudoalteromonas luteoviolacea S4047-1]
MVGKKSAIRKYQSKLRPELSQRYGGSHLYTQAQVDIIIKELGLSERYIQYAYLMYCDINLINNARFQNESVESMNQTIAAAIGGGLIATSIDSIFFGGDSGDGGFGGGGE